MIRHVSLISPNPFILQPYTNIEGIGYGYDHQIWTMIETWLGIICACVPFLQKQFSAQGVFGSKISAGWSRMRSWTSSLSSSSSPSETRPAMVVVPQESRQTETSTGKILSKSSVNGEIGVSQSYSIEFSDKTFYDSSSV